MAKEQRSLMKFYLSGIGRVPLPWAMRYLDEDNVPGALHHLWQAVDMNPDNVGYSMELAGLLSDIERYDESNEILLMVMQNEEAPGECFYGLGCNFLGMGDLSNAEESLEQYLSRDPDGDFIEEAIAILDNIEEHRRDHLQPVDLSGSDESERRKAREGNKLLQAGEFRQAIRTLKEVNLTGEEGISARNDLAVAYYFDGQLDEAARVARKILRDHPGQLQTMCNLALFIHKSDREEALRLIEGRRRGRTDPLLNYRVGVVLCEMGEHEGPAGDGSVRRPEPIGRENPHYYALACYNSGQCKGGGDLERLRRIGPGSTVISCIATGRAAPRRRRARTASLQHAVPEEEGIRRIRRSAPSAESQSHRELGGIQSSEPAIWGMTRKTPAAQCDVAELVAAGAVENERCASPLCSAVTNR